MDKINLDISKYSCKELQDIFNINNIVSSDQVVKHFNTYKNTIFSDQILSLNEKDNVASFLNKVITKIINSLDKSKENSIDSTLSFSSPLNPLVKGTAIEHPIIANQNSVAGINAKTYEGQTLDIKDYPPGYINPINIKTIRRVVNVDTRFRDSYYATKSTDFGVQLPEQFKKVVNMRLSSFEIPLSIYSISKALGNTHFHIDSSCVDISDGNYYVSKEDGTNNYNIWAVINNWLSSHHPLIKFDFDQFSGKSSFINNGPSQKLHFNKASGSDNIEDLDTPLPLKLGWLLGFRAGSYTLEHGIPVYSEGICSIVGPKYIYLCINDYTNAANNHFIAAFSSSTLSPHIITRINYQHLREKYNLWSYGEDNDFNDNNTRSREYFGPVDIQKLHFQILDEYGRVIDFNNMDWSCALTFDILYD